MGIGRARVGVLAAAALALGAAGCERPILARDGTLVFSEPGARGAAVLTANGVEFHDREDIPARVVHRDADEPWRAPIGFILPASGRFTATSRPTVLATTGLALAMRPSDTRVPSWGGEVLVRIDVIAPAPEGTARMGERVVIVLAGAGEDTSLLVDAALEQLAARDRAGIVDANGGEVVVPMLPASHRTLLGASVERRIDTAPCAPGSAGCIPERMRSSHKPRNLARALHLAGELAEAGSGARRVLVIGDGAADTMLPEVQREVQALASRGVAVSAVGSSAHADSNGVASIGIAGGGVVGTSEDLGARIASVRTAIPEAGRVAFRDVVLTFEGTPAPSHVLEASGSHVAWRLDAGQLLLGDVHAGEGRTEVVRVTVPAWVPGERFAFTVHANYKEEATGLDREMHAELASVYDDDIERIAESRHGDVIAYASALATLRRLDAAFASGSVRRAGGIERLARMHAKSMALLARDTSDPAIIEQAEVLGALLDVH